MIDGSCSDDGAPAPGGSPVEQYPELELQARADFTARAKGGAVIYTIVWALVVSWAGLWTTDTVFAVANLAFLSFLSALRLAHHLGAVERATGPDRAFNWLVGLILTGAFHWGALSAWIIFSGRHDELRYPFMIMLSAFAMGGTAVLSILRLVRILYPVFVLVPTLVVGMIVGGREHYMLVSLAICSLLYMLAASRTSASDYWDAAYNTKVADERARMLEAVSLTDPLTGVGNRLHFTQRLDKDWRVCARRGAHLSVLLIDLDHFKRINDTNGHPAGDLCLRNVAAVLDARLQRAGDTLARYGGEEFVALLPDTGVAAAEQVGDELRQLVAGLAIVHEGVDLPVTCSIGVATVVPDRFSGDPDQLVAAADRALYEAKARGRNRVESGVAIS